MKRKLTKLNAALCLVLAQSAAHAGTGNLFNVSASGTPGSISFTLCLNAKAQLSCQVYTVTALTLSITTALNHAYPDAGIKITTPGYTPTGCTPIENGFCSFSGSKTTSTIITVQSNNASSILTAAGQNNNTNQPLLVQSTDNAGSWKVISTPVFTTDGYFSASSCTSGGVCTAVGRDGAGAKPLIAATVDSGASWAVKTISALRTLDGYLNATSCTGSGATAICIAAGTHTSNVPLLVVSTDGSATWNTVPGLPASGYLNATSCTGSGVTAVCTAAGEDRTGTQPPLLAVSTNGGVNWSMPVISGLTTKGHFNATSCTGSGSSAVCVAGGEDMFNDSGAPLLVVSTNGGVDWSVKSISGSVPSEASFYTTSCTGSGATALCVAAGEDNTGSRPPILAVSTDGGSSWAMQSSIFDLPSDGRFTSSSCVGSGPSAICTLAGYRSSTPYSLLAVSTDGGASWAVKTVSGLTNSGQFNGTQCIGTGVTAICTAVGYDYTGTNDPVIAVSKDGGANWAAIVTADYQIPTNSRFNGAGGAGLMKRLTHKKFGAANALEGIMQPA